MIVCICNGVNDEKIIQYIRENEVKTVDEVSFGLGVCNQCQSCYGEIEKIIAKEINGKDNVR